MNAQQKAVDKSERPAATVEEIGKTIKQAIIKLSITRKLTPSKTIEALEQNIQELKELQRKWAEEDAAKVGTQNES